MRIAVICSQRPQRHGMGGNIVLALRGLGVHAERFAPNSEPDGWDRYFYIDRSSLVQKHPSVFWACEMVVPQINWLRSVKKYEEYAKEADKTYAACKMSAEHLGVEWMPFAANPDYHRPWPDEEKIYDVIALWHNCQNRIEYTKVIRASGFKQFVGYADGERYSQWMNRARCAVNLGRVDEMNLRIFEVMAMGVPLVTDRCRNLGELFTEDEHYLGYDNPGEMLEKIAWVQGHPEEAHEMATRARKEVLAKHTFHHRVLLIFA